MQLQGNTAAPRQTQGLDTLPRGVAAVVAGLRQPEDGRASAMALRLMEIGFLPGEPVSVIARGFPAADPLAVRVGQATFALRRHEAQQVLVHVAEGAA
ncbi:MAG: ferrous iron transport protein A [Comamonadaceae bacterium]|nr:ferrous iron transport protein A [Pseudomonadota bacterium]MBS0608500.1 ferrous iron transport protein A [Pseudomonadota bacterium]MDE2413742.1 ferrous iron transport protein A [Comamonadaceae bacterium]